MGILPQICYWFNCIIVRKHTVWFQPFKIYRNMLYSLELSLCWWLFHVSLKRIFCCWVECFVNVNWIKLFDSVQLYFYFLPTCSVRTVRISNYNYNFFQFCQFFLHVLWISVMWYTFRIVMSFWWIGKCPFLHLIIFFCFEVYFDNTLATPAFFGLLVWNNFPHPFYFN